MLERFHSLIQDISKKSDKTLRILVAVSGGVDSVVLAHLCKTEGISFSIAHCNFNLRGEESDLDQEFVEKLSEELEVSLFLQSFDTADQAKKRASSIQVTARDLRYEWFKELLDKHKFDYLFTAHHFNDKIETTIFNLLRGTGIPGLRSMKFQNNRIIRPLIEFSKQDIEFYAVVNGFSWREDQSNKKDKYTRNYIRHHVIPHFDKIHESWESSLKVTYEKLEQTENVLNKLSEELVQELEHGKLSYEEVLSFSIEPIILDKALKGFGFSYVQSKKIFQALREEKSSIEFLSSTHKISLERGAFYLLEGSTLNWEKTEINRQEEEISFGTWKITSRINDRKTFKFKSDKLKAYFDVSKVAFPLSVDSWKEGDTFSPFGMKGRKKKVSDFFIDEKIPRHEKEKIPIIKDANETILWVAGYRQSEKFIVNHLTEEVLILQLI